MGRQAAGLEAWFVRYEREWILAVVAIGVVLRGFLVTTAPPYGYVWDFYREGVAVIAREGRLPVAADCWQCYHPPVFYLAGWPLHELGLWIGGPRAADRLLSSLSLLSAAVVTWYGYRLLRLFQFRGAPLIGGFALVVASPLLFISSYGAEADILLSAILAAFAFHLAEASTKPAGFERRALFTLGVLAGLAAATKYSGLVAIATAGVVTGLRLVQRNDRLAVARHGLVVLALTIAIGGWKYVDNYRQHGTVLHANGSASEGLTFGARDNRGGYEFTTFRFAELRTLFGPRPPAGSLTEFPVYKSVLTSLHAQAWSDMSFFSVPTRHGDAGQPYARKITPVRLVMALIVLALVAEILAVLGLVVTLRDDRYWTLAAMTVVTLVAYVVWFLPQETWALKTKYVASLVPIFAVYAAAGVQWTSRHSIWAGRVGVTLLFAVAGLSFVYQFAFANGRL